MLGSSACSSTLAGLHLPSSCSVHMKQAACCHSSATTRSRGPMRCFAAMSQQPGFQPFSASRQKAHLNHAWVQPGMQKRITGNTTAPQRHPATNSAWQPSGLPAQQPHTLSQLPSRHPTATPPRQPSGLPSQQPNTSSQLPSRHPQTQSAAPPGNRGGSGSSTARPSPAGTSAGPTMGTKPFPGAAQTPVKPRLHDGLPSTTQPAADTAHRRHVVGPAPFPGAAQTPAKPRLHGGLPSTTQPAADTAHRRHIFQLGLHTRNGLRPETTTKRLRTQDFSHMPVVPISTLVTSGQQVDFASVRREFWVAVREEAGWVNGRPQAAIYMAMQPILNDGMLQQQLNSGSAEPLTRTEAGESFQRFCDVSQDKWRCFRLQMVGEFDPFDENGTVWPNAIIHNRRQIFNIARLDYLVAFLADPVKERVVKHMHNLISHPEARKQWRAYPMQPAPPTPADRAFRALEARWGGDVLKEFNMDKRLLATMLSGVGKPWPASVSVAV